MTIQLLLSLHLGPYPAGREGQNLNHPGKSRRKLPQTPSTKAHRHHGIVTCALIFVCDGILRVVKTISLCIMSEDSPVQFLHF